MSGGTDLFGWEVPSAAGAGPVSFGVGDAPEGTAPRWRLDLPADPQQATSSLDAHQARLQAMQSALEGIPARLAALTARTRPAPGVVSFSATTESGPEAGLLDLLGQPTPAQVSFGLLDGLSGEWERVEADFRQFMEQARQLVGSLAWVETRQEGILLGHSVVTWGGDTLTAWDAGASAAQCRLHQRSLALSLESRTLALRTVLIVAQGAAKITVLLTTGGAGAILALPAAWKFVSQVLAEIRQRRDPLTETGG